MRSISSAHSILGFSVVLWLSFAAVNPPMAQPRGAVPSRPNASPSNEDQPAASETPATARKPIQPIGARTVIACDGPFAKDSGMLTLAMVYGSQNMIFAEEKVQGTNVGMTVLYPKDPKRRLEVWWSNPNRTGLYLIDIAGKSVWTGPNGLRLGLTLPAVEKLNHKPFKLKGFDKDGVATVTNWDDGALAALPGGCRAGASFHADPKSSKDAVSAISADNEFSSDDRSIQAVKPTVSEILVGY